jgi:hypothetical protein
MPSLIALRKALAATALVAAPAGSGLLVSTTPAQAEYFEVICASQSPGPWADSMFCNQAHMVDVSGPTLATHMMLTIEAPASHCSATSYVINRLPGSSEAIAVLERMAPGERREVDLGAGWAEEGNAITVTAVGHVGGCNAGQMHSWGADVVIRPAAMPVAAPAVLLEDSFATDCGASTPYEAYPGVASVMCDRRIVVDFISPGPGHDLEITVAAPASHCSTVSYFVNRPGTAFTYAMTDRLGPRDPVKLDLGNDWPAGRQQIDIGAVGHVDGCNAGALQSWGVDVRLMSLN